MNYEIVLWTDPEGCGTHCLLLHPKYLHAGWKILLVMRVRVERYCHYQGEATSFRRLELLWFMLARLHPP